MILLFLLAATAELPAQLAAAAPAERMALLRVAMTNAQDAADRGRIYALMSLLAKVPADLRLSPAEVEAVARVALDGAQADQAAAALDGAVAAARARADEADGPWRAWATQLAPELIAGGLRRLDAEITALPAEDPRQAALEAAALVLDRYPLPWADPDPALLHQALGPRASERKAVLLGLSGTAGIAAERRIYGRSAEVLAARWKLQVVEAWWYLCADEARPAWHLVDDGPGLPARSASAWAESNCEDVSRLEKGWTLADGLRSYETLADLSEAGQPIPPNVCDGSEPTSSTYAVPVPGVFGTNFVEFTLLEPEARIPDCLPVAAAKRWTADLAASLDAALAGP